MSSWIVQRVVYGDYYNGFRKNPWSESVVCALAFETKEDAKAEMVATGWNNVRFLPLPSTRVRT